ncbi:hypothetical protein Ga0061061_103225 [Chelatococcus sambhunathii]|uniref:Uncharacterized protein n=1 Tax=Chelatococcus sambhunathii TaxID=363953 RepID=A0ABP2A1V9_9HYPH|nr:hypothetical protein Ga0061061_103225 [Chelatococcus sambhunathii]
MTTTCRRKGNSGRLPSRQPASCCQLTTERHLQSEPPQAADHDRTTEPNGAGRTHQPSIGPPIAAPRRAAPRLGVASAFGSAPTQPEAPERAPPPGCPANDNDHRGRTIGRRPRAALLPERRRRDTLRARNNPAGGSNTAPPLSGDNIPSPQHARNPHLDLTLGLLLYAARQHRNLADSIAIVVEMTKGAIKISLTLIFLPPGAESCLLRQTAYER